MNLRDPDPAAFDAWASTIIARSKATPYFNLDGYMERWWLQRPPGHGSHSDTSEKAKTGHGSRIHHILRSDQDGAFHDHPWPSKSVVLIGGYMEVMPLHQDQSPALDNNPKHCIHIWRRPGDVVMRKAEDRHRLVLPAGETAWSLFLMGSYEQGWGFYTPAGKVPHLDYFATAA